MNVKSEKKKNPKYRKNAIEEPGDLPQIKGIDELAVLIHDRMGLHFTENKKRELIQGIIRSAKAFAYSSTESFVNFLLKKDWDQEIIDLLAAELTIGETYFLRDRKMFDMIVNYVIPEKSNEKKLKFWSAACSTGEEPYSIALTLDMAIPDINSWEIEVLATDINRDALRKAEKGVYRPWSFRESQFPDKDHYFRKNDSGCFEISNKIKKMVKFSRLNLISETYPSALNRTTDCDIIFCRNVLIYFSFGTAVGVIENLYNCLKPGGLLILSATELALVPENLFDIIELCGTLILKKPLTLNGASNLWQSSLNSSDNCDIRTNSIFDRNNKECKELKLTDVDVKHVKQKGSKSVASKQEKTDILKVFSSGENYEEAERLADRGNYKEAAQMCQQAIEENPLNPKWHYLYSVVLFESDRLSDAAEAVSKVLYLDADNVMGHIMSGHINNALGNQKLAKKSFDNAVVLLREFKSDDVVNGSGGVNAERLKATIEAVYG